MSGNWLSKLFVWAGIALILAGGIVGYPMLRDYLTTPDAESLDFVVTLPPSPKPAAQSPTAGALEDATPAPEQADETTQSPTAAPVGTRTTVTPTATTERSDAPTLIPEPPLGEIAATGTSDDYDCCSLGAFDEEMEAIAAAMPDISSFSVGSAPTRILIRAISLDAPVVPVGFRVQIADEELVTSWNVPKFFAAGWHFNSAPLGSPGNTVLNGHHNIYDRVFRDLVEVEPGDEIIVYAGGETFYYAITERHVFKSKDEPLQVQLDNAEWVKPTDDERLTLVTCWPPTDNTHRLVLVALPIPPNPTPETPE